MRTGVAPAGPSPTGVTRRWSSPKLDGIVYAQPLVIGDRVIAATEGGSVYALRLSDGGVIWRHHVADPVPGSALPCGNIDRTGITSTPFIDPATQTVYAIAFTQPFHHVLVALDVSTGAPRWQRDLDPPNLSPQVEQQRAGLTITGGRVYVGFGGLYGDCGPYKGAVVSSSLNGSGPLQSWVVPTRREGAVWAPSGPAVDANGDLWVATGNTVSTATFDFGNTVVRLSPTLQVQDYFAPSDWAQLSATDGDLGSISPALLGNDLAFIAGKDGTGYLLRTSALGHIGGQVAKSRVCQQGAYGGTAWSAPNLVVGCAEGPVGVQVSGDRFHVTWTGSGGQGGAPAIAAGTAWIAQRGGHLVAVDVTSGKVRADVDIGTDLEGFPSPTLTPGLVLVPGSNAVLAYGSQPG